MAIKLTSTAEAAKAHGVKTLVYGDAGVGKTLLTSTAPAPVLISAESGLLSLRQSNIEKVHGAEAPTVSYNIPVIEIRNIEDLMEAYTWATESAECAQFETIALDSISEIAEVVLSNAKAQCKDPRQAYGELIEKMTTTVKAFRDLSGKHVYMAAKMEMQKDEASGISLYGPSCPGAKLAQQLPFLFDEVFQLGVGKTAPTDGSAPVSYRYLRTQPDLQFKAKDRSGALEEIEKPDLTHVFNKILSGDK
jgi:hypothetical protein